MDPEIQEKQLFEQRSIKNNFQSNDPQYGFFRFVHESGSEPRGC